MYLNIWGKYLHVKNNKEPFRTPRWLTITFHVVSWGLSICLCIAVLAAGKTETDPEGYWCFINSEYIGWRMAVLIVPTFVCWILTLVLCIATNVIVWKLKNLIMTQKARRTEKVKLVEDTSTWTWQLRLLLIPALYFIMRFLDYFERMWETGCIATDTNTPTFFLLSVLRVMRDYLRYFTRVGKLPNLCGVREGS